jgi:hypothetical protein
MREVARTGLTVKEPACYSFVFGGILVGVERSWEENEIASLRQRLLTAGGSYGHLDAK